MFTISELFIYPIKSLGGITVPEATITDRGFKHDRRWMLVDEQNKFLTQREFAAMALLQVSLTYDGLHVHHKIKGSTINIAAEPQTNEMANAVIWDDICEVQFVSEIADEWFSDMLSTKCRLVYMPEATKRKVEQPYAQHDEITSLSDGYPTLIIGQSSLDDLNSRLSEPLPINRFRPNIVFSGGIAFEEDNMKHFTVGDINFYGVKLCGRCPIPTINQDNAVQSKEPLKTLASYRTRNNKVCFGQNLLHNGEGYIHVGDMMNVHEWKL